MLHLTSLGASAGVRAAAVAGSVVLHAAVLVTTLGHPSAAPGKDASQAIEVELAAAAETQVELAPAAETQVDLAPPVTLAKDETAAPHAHASPELPHHTHPYPVPPVAPPPALTAESEMPHFTMAVGTGDPDAHGHLSGGATSHEAEGDDGSPVPQQHVTSRARLASGGAPAYPEEARADGIEADVPLEIIVSPAGTVETARVLRLAGHGLDAAAVDAVRRYRFTPATKDGHPVRVRMQWLVQFRLR